MTALHSTWRLETLENCCEIISGSTPSRNNPQYWKGDILWATPTNLSNLKGRIIEDTSEKITQLGYDSCSTTMIPKHSILFSSRATIGLVAIAGKPMCTNQGFKNIVPGSEVYYAYLYWCMRYFTPHIAAKANGTTFKEVSKKTIANFAIPLPPFEEQKRIALILDKGDEIRCKRQQAIALTDELLRSFFLKMFGDPVTNPKGWEVRKLGELTTLISSGSTPLGGEQVYLDDGPVMLIRSQNVLMRSLNLDNVAFITEEINALMKRTIVNYQDVLLNITGASIGRVATFELPEKRANVNQHVCIIRTKPNILNPRFLMHLIALPNFQDYINTIQTGSTRQALNLTKIRELKIPLPSIQQQNYFILSDQLINSYINRAKTMLQESDKLFNCLMQKAFKGQL